MGNIIQQYRFYNKNSNRNFNIDQGSSNKCIEQLTTGSFLQKKPIIQLGIQALEGTRFYLNNIPKPIIIGENGIFELKLNGVAEIHNIRFDLVSIDAIMKNTNAILIIDVVYLNNT